MSKPSLMKLHTFSERNFYRLGVFLVKNVKKKLRHQYSLKDLQEPKEIKGTHDADRQAYLVIASLLREVKVRVVVEGMPIINPHIGRPVLYIDPVDGSRNWDRQVGDPAFAMAFCPIASPHRLADVQWAYVEGLLSGDRYYTLKGKAYYRNQLTAKTVMLPKKQSSLALHEAVAYIKPGYSAAAKVLDIGEELMKAVKDIRAFDNSAMELCHLARGACQLILEARDLSDFFNLLAYPILKATACSLYSLDGQALDQETFMPEEVVNFLALQGGVSLEEVLEKLG